MTRWNRRTSLRGGIIATIAWGLLNVFCGGGGGMGGGMMGGGMMGGTTGPTPSGTTTAFTRAAEDAAESSGQAASLARIAADAFWDPANFALVPGSVGCPAVQHQPGASGGVLAVHGGCSDDAGNDFGNAITIDYARQTDGTGSTLMTFDNWSVMGPAGTHMINGMCWSQIDGGMTSLLNEALGADLTLVENGQTVTVQMNMTCHVTMPQGMGSGPMITINGTATYQSPTAGMTTVSYADVTMSPMACSCPSGGVATVTAGGAVSTVTFLGACGQAQVQASGTAQVVTMGCGSAPWQGCAGTDGGMMGGGMMGGGMMGGEQ